MMVASLPLSSSSLSVVSHIIQPNAHTSCVYAIIFGRLGTFCYFSQKRVEYRIASSASDPIPANGMLYDQTLCVLPT